MARTSLSVARLPVDPLGIIGLLALVALWWGLSQFHFLSRLALPPPAGVAAAITQNFFSSSYLANYHLGYGGLAGNLAYTISNVVVALAVSCVVGVALGFASARVELFRAFADPIMLTAGTIPILVTAPFFLIWFGTSRSAQIALLILFDVTIVYLFAQRAAANLDPTYVAAGRTLGAGPMKNRLRRLPQGRAARGVRRNSHRARRRLGARGLFRVAWRAQRRSAGSFRRWPRRWTLKWCSLQS